MRARLGLALAGLALGCAPVPDAREIERGDAALARERAYDAQDAYRSALVLRPDDPDALLGLARAHLMRRDGLAALDPLARLRAAHPVYFEARARVELRRALVEAAGQRMAAGDPGEALRLLDRLDAPGAAASPVRALRRRAALAEAGRLCVAGRAEEADSLLGGTLRCDPEGWLPLARRLLDAGNVGLAISLLSDAQRRRPHDPRVAGLMDRALRIRYPNPPGALEAPRTRSEGEAPEGEALPEAALPGDADGR